MQVRKTYKGLNPTLLYDELREIVTRYGLELTQNKLETYSIPGNSSSFVYRGSLGFSLEEKECLRINLIGEDKLETRLLIDSDEGLLSDEKTSAITNELDFMLGKYEVK
jgi:hypothetical protein